MLVRMMDVAACGESIKVHLVLGEDVQGYRRRGTARR